MPDRRTSASTKSSISFIGLPSALATFALASLPCPFNRPVSSFSHIAATPASVTRRADCALASSASAFSPFSLANASITGLSAVWLQYTFSMLLTGSTQVPWFFPTHFPHVRSCVSVHDPAYITSVYVCCFVDSFYVRSHSRAAPTWYHFPVWEERFVHRPISASLCFPPPILLVFWSRGLFPPASPCRLRDSFALRPTPALPPRQFTPLTS